MWNKFKNSYIELTLLVILNFTAGMFMIIYPSKCPLYVIVGIGLVWVLDGVDNILNIILLYFKNKIKNYE